MENETNQPALCRNGCGFYGSQSTEGMCSKCFKDVLRRKQSSPTSAPSSSSSIPASVEGSSSNTSVEGAVAMAASLSSSSVLSSLPSTSTDTTSKDDRQPTADVEAGLSDEPKDKTKHKRNRCFTCRKKVGLTGFECRCGNVFCGLHRYSDKHDCTFDYKAEGRAKITKDNPVILAKKIQKI